MENSSYISIAYQNVRGMNTKLNSFYLDSFGLNHNVIVLTETWLKDKPDKIIHNSEIMCNKFQIYRRDRVVRDGGGVLIAVCSHLPSEEIIPNVKDIEFIAICIKLNNRKVFITCSYIPPSSSLHIYELHSLAIEYIVKQSVSRDSIIVLGDFNLPYIIWHENPDSNFLSPSTTSESNSSFVDSLADFGLLQLNNIPNSLGRLLDLVFVDDPDDFNLKRIDPIIMPEDVYHPCLEITINSANNPTVKNDLCSELVFNFKKTDYTKLNNILNSENWFDYSLDYNLNPKEIDTIIEKFYIGLYNSFKRSIPMMKKRVSNGPPWNTKELTRLKNTKNKFYKRYKKSGLNSDYALYSVYRSLYNLTNTQAYKLYLSKVRANFKSNSKSFFQFVNSKRRVFSFPAMMKNDTTVSSHDQDICNMFAEFFASSYSTKKWNQLNEYPYPIHELAQISQPKLHPSTISKAIHKLKNSESFGPDGVPSCILINCSQALIMPLTFLFNLSLVAGYFPNCWKESFIIPLFKSGNRSNISNYRGIAKLSIIPKLFEQIVTDYLSHQISSFLSPSQHGFRKGRSTITNLLEFSSAVISSFTKGMQTDTIYTDFSKAFDKVNHNLLIYKLDKIGFSPVFVKWISSYLIDRFQCIKFRNHKSKNISIPSGVPQGSHLGPLLFLIYINDLPSCVKYSNILMYADDVKLFLHLNDSRFCNLLQIDLQNFYQWCNINLMELNFKKCKFMLFYRANPVVHSYKFDTYSIEKVDSFLDLGVLLDSKLTFNPHISLIANKAKGVLGFIKRWGKEFKDPYVLKNLFTSLVRPILEYASVIWDPQYEIHINKIESVQKQFLLFCLRNLQWNSNIVLPPYESRLALIKLPTLKSRRTFLNISFVNNVIRGVIDSETFLRQLEFIIPTRPTRYYVPLKLHYFRSNYANFDPVRRMCAEFNNHFFLIDYSSNCNTLKNRIMNFLNI